MNYEDCCDIRQRGDEPTRGYILPNFPDPPPLPKEKLREFMKYQSYLACRLRGDEPQKVHSPYRGSFNECLPLPNGEFHSKVLGSVMDFEPFPPVEKLRECKHSKKSSTNIVVYCHGIPPHLNGAFAAWAVDAVVQRNIVLDWSPSGEYGTAVIIVGSKKDADYLAKLSRRILFDRGGIWIIRANEEMCLALLDDYTSKMELGIVKTPINLPKSTVNFVPIDADEPHPQPKCAHQQPMQANTAAAAANRSAVTAVVHYAAAAIATFLAAAAVYAHILIGSPVSKDHR